MESKAELYKKCIVNPNKLIEIDKLINKILLNKGQYIMVEAYTKVPWFVVAALHMRESTLNFNCNLANGEPINQKTKLVPKGFGPWENWYDSAIFALKYDGLDKKTDWSLQATLQTIMAYNGRGYEEGGKGYNTKPPGRTPYLWSFTDQYECGKFTEKWYPFIGYKSSFSSSLVDQQCGVAALFKRMEDKGIVLFQNDTAVLSNESHQNDKLNDTQAPKEEINPVEEQKGPSVAPKRSSDNNDISFKDKVKNFLRSIFG